MSTTHATFAIERRVSPPPAQVFRAFSESALKQRWFGKGDHELDFRVGGEEVNVGNPHGAGPPHTFRARFHEIVEAERIVYAYDLLVGDHLMSVSLATVELHPDGEGTRLVLTEQGAFFDDPADAAGREHGTRLLLDALEAFLR